MTLVFLLACATEDPRFSDARVVARVGGDASVLEVLSTDPWQYRADELQAARTMLEGPPPRRPARALSRDVAHTRNTAVRDLLRFIEREVLAANPDAEVPSDEEILEAALTARLDSVPSKQVMAELAAACDEAGMPLPGGLVAE